MEFEGKVTLWMGNPQDDEVGSAMTEELSSSVVQYEYGSRGQQVCGSIEKKSGGLERMGSGMSVVSGFGGDCEGKYSVLEQGKLPSSQYKGVVPQPNRRWGAQIYEKHQRIWLGTFNKEEDAATAYDRAAQKYRGREAITNFRPLRDDDPESLFMNEFSKAEIVDMLRKHTYDEELHHHSKNSSKTTVDRVVSVDRVVNASTPSSLPVGNLGSHLFDKAVTPSDVGKLNRLVIPKQHAEKYFPMDANSSDKGLLLNFEDNGGKAWRFRYSYWNSSQSYVLTKGWSRFVKENKLQAGDIVSFHRGTRDSSRPHQLYITWRRRPCGQQTATLQSKTLFPLAYGSLTNFYPSAYNPQWTHTFWPGSESPMDPWPSPVVPLYFRAPSKQPDRHFVKHIVHPGNGSGLLQNQQKEVPTSSEPATMSKGVRLFGVNLAESPELLLFR